MILEGGNYYFNTQLYDDLNLQETAFPTIEYFGVENDSNLATYLGHVYNTDHCSLLIDHVGKNLHDLRVFTDDLIYTPDQKVDFYAKLDLKGSGWETEYNKFQYKISCLYSRPEVQYLLDQGSLDYAVLDVLNNFSKTPEITVPGPIGEELKQKSIIRAFIELGLLYAEKHQSFMSCRRVYRKFFKRYYEAEVKKMTILQRLDFLYWRAVKGIHVTGMNENLERNIKSSYNDTKEEADWDVDLYDQNVGRRDDPGNERIDFKDKYSRKLNFQAYGKFSEFPYFRFNLISITVMLDKFMNYPAAYTHLKEKHKKEGNPEPVITQPYDKWLEKKATEYSSLPQTDSEVKISFTPEENQRAMLKAAYIYDNPEKLKNPITS